jgi:hypothetical protein
MRKFRASMEPFWDLKIGKYVEHLMLVSSEYLISCELLSLTSTAGRTSRVFLAYVIPWINKAGLELYIARHRAACHDRPIWSLEAVLRSRVRPYGWSIETYHYRDRESVSDSISAIEALLCTHHIYWQPFTTCTITTMQLLGTWSQFHTIIKKHSSAYHKATFLWVWQIMRIGQNRPLDKFKYTIFILCI